MAFSGTVASMGLDEVFGFLATNGLEGALTITGPGSMRLYFREGRIFFPYRRTQSGRLVPASAQPRSPGQRTDSGRLSRRALDDLFQRASKVLPNRRSEPVEPEPVQALVEGGDGLEEGQRQQARERIHEALGWPDARFRFDPGPLPAALLRDIDGGGVLALDTTAVLMESARRTDEGQGAPTGGPRPPVQAGERAIEGDLDGIGLAAVLQALRTHHRTGTLAVEAREREERLFFLDGDVFALRTEEDSEFARFFLGDTVADTVTDTMTSLAKSALDSPGLVKQSDLTEEELRAVKDQFLDLLFWKGAEFAFYQDQLPDEFHEADGKTVTRIALETDQFLVEAIQRLLEWDQIRRLVSGELVPRFVDASHKLSTIRERRDSLFLTLIDGRQSFEDLVRLSGQQHLEVGRVLQELIDRGHLEMVEPE